MRPSFIRSVTGTRSLNASATRDNNAGYTIGVLRDEGVRMEVGELRPGIGGRCCERLPSAIRNEFDAADMDMERSWFVRSLRIPGPPGIVLADSDERLEPFIERSTRVEEAADDGVAMLDPFMVAMMAVSSWRGAGPA